MDLQKGSENMATKKYTAKECTCWCDYPNAFYNKDGHSKCLGQYRNIRLKQGHYRKTKCVLIEEGEKKNDD